MFDVRKTLDLAIALVVLAAWLPISAFAWPHTAAQIVKLTALDAAVAPRVPTSTR